MTDYQGPKGYSELYSSFGGKALGKLLSKDLSQKIDHLEVPSVYCIRIDEILNGELPGNLEQLMGKKIVLKLSKTGDDFSTGADRGKNSSLGLPKLVGNTDLINDLKEIVLSQDLEEDVKAIILDEMIQLPNDYLYLVIYDGKKIKIEISRNDKERLYYELDLNGNILILESNSNNIHHDEIPSEIFQRLLDIHKQIYNTFGNISINTEGFYGNDNYIMIQVRPTPHEIKNTNLNVEIENELYEENRETNFIYGVFDYEGFPNLIDESNHLDEGKKMFILDENIRWFSPLIQQRLKKGLPTILIDIYDGFNISHDPKLLPHYGDIRNNFQYISYSGDSELTNKKIRVLSNGEKGNILIYKNNNMSKDKFEARDKKKVCTFKYHNNDFEYPKEKVTSTGVVTFTEDGKVMVVEIDRGYDIPGGHVQEADIDFISAVKREAMEEAYITLKDISLSTVVESDYFGSEPDKLTYMLFYTAFIDNILDFVPNDESFSREIMEIDEFIKVFKGDKELISNIVHNAYDQKFTK